MIGVRRIYTFGIRMAFLCISLLLALSVTARAQGNVITVPEGGDIQAAINQLPWYGGRTLVEGHDYWLSAGLRTSTSNIEIDCIGGNGSAISHGSVVIHVPAGAVGFTFNPSAASTQMGGPTIRGCEFLGESGASGGIHIVRTDHFLLDHVNVSDFPGGYDLYLDGEGDWVQQAEVINSTFGRAAVAIKMYHVSAMRLTGNMLDGGGTPIPGTVGIWQTGASDTSFLSQNVIQGFDTLVRLDRCEDDVLTSNRFEIFLTGAIRLDTSSGYCHGVQIIGGSINNYLESMRQGTPTGTGIIIGTGVARTLVIISNITSVATPMSNAGTATDPILN